LSRTGFYICNADGATPSWEFQSVAAGTACVNGLYVGTAGALSLALAL